MQELRTAFALRRRLARARTNWDKRVVFFIDSIAALGVLSQGRPNSPPLLLVSRQVVALSLILGIYVTPRYIPSEGNPADGPSRGQRGGAAPETQLAHADRLKVSFAEALQMDREAPLDDPAVVARLLAQAGYAGG